jgi:hypothetical protein
MENTKNRKQRTAVLRKALKEKYGARKYRIVGTIFDESIHIYSQMPNSSDAGWWLMGDLDTAELWMSI